MTDNTKKKDTDSFISGELPNISPLEAYKLCMKDAVLTDIRGDYITAFKKFDVPEVIYFPNVVTESIPIESFDKEKTYIIAETSTSINSREIVRKLINEGFQYVYNLAGGFVEWERDGLPILENKKARLSGSCMCQLKPQKNNDTV